LNTCVSSNSSGRAEPTQLGCDSYSLNSLKECPSSSTRRSTLCSIPSSRRLISCSTAAPRTHSSYKDRHSDIPLKTCSVSFGAVDIRDYELVLGDSPSVSEGPPLSIGWRYKQRSSVSVDEHEMTRGLKRRKGVRIIPPLTRVMMLISEANVPLKEVADAEARARRDRENMIKTAEKARIPGFQQLEEIKEITRRKVGRFVIRRNKKREEKEPWKKAHTVATATAALPPMSIKVSTPRSA